MATTGKRLTETALSDLVLKSGGHNSRAEGMCFMEAAAYFAGQKHSDRPPCVCPVIGAFSRNWNDRIKDDGLRNELLKPLVPVVVWTKGSAALEQRRAYRATDWAIRERLPELYDLIEPLKEYAAKLRALDPIVDKASAQKARESAIAASAAIAAIDAIDASAAIAAIAASDAIDASAASAASAAIAAIAASDAIDASAAIAARKRLRAAWDRAWKHWWSLTPAQRDKHREKVRAKTEPHLERTYRSGAALIRELAEMTDAAA